MKCSCYSLYSVLDIQHCTCLEVVSSVDLMRAVSSSAENTLSHYGITMGTHL